jgi:S1-C subfamily serine protease
MRKFWFGSLSLEVGSLAAAFFALLLTTANAPAQSRSDSDRDDSSSTSSASSRDNDRSSRDNQSNNNQSSSSRDQSGGRSSSGSSQANRQQEHMSLGVMLYNDRSNPLEVRRVMPQSPAEEAGLQRGDEILSVNGQRVSSVDQLRRQIDRIGSDQEVEIGILRDGQRETVTATLSSHRSQGSSSRGQYQQQFSNESVNRRGNQQQYAENNSSRGGHQQSYSVRQTGGNVEEFDQWSRNPAYEQGFWDGYAHAQQQYGHPAFANQGSNQSGNNQYGSTQYGNNQSGNRSYSRGSRNTGSSQYSQSQGDDRYSEGNRGSRDRAFLGITLDENAGDRVRVSGVYPNGPAEQAGIRQGDEIVAIDEQDVHSTRDLQRLLADYDPDDDVSLTVDRNGRKRTLQASLESQQEVFAEYNRGSERMGRRNSYGQSYGSQGTYRDGENNNRRQRQQDRDDDSDNDNY